MTDAERLLDLAEEYRQAKENEKWAPVIDGPIASRDPAVIADEYVALLRTVTTPEPS